ncbi:MAG TPA: ECF transporter S component [Clostridia bacterium]|nr:ECF transporter S component [Clostridia bacterium]
MNKFTTKNLALSAMFFALGLVMPFLTMQIPSLGSKLLPMHIPVLLCGFVCGWPYGLIVGLVLPVFRSLIFSMPPMFPTAVAMTFELAVYGFTAGLFYKLFPKKAVYVFVSLVLAMICGRIVWGAASIFLYGFNNTAFTWEIFVSGAVINAIPGIVIQLVLIPVVIIALQKAKLIE